MAVDRVRSPMEAAKGALITLTRCLAKELGLENIGLLAISLCATATQKLDYEQCSIR